MKRLGNWLHSPTAIGPALQYPGPVLKFCVWVVRVPVPVPVRDLHCLQSCSRVAYGHGHGQTALLNIGTGPCRPRRRRSRPRQSASLRAAHRQRSSFDRSANARTRPHHEDAAPRQAVIEVSGASRPKAALRLGRRRHREHAAPTSKMRRLQARAPRVLVSTAAPRRTAPHPSAHASGASACHLGVNTRSRPAKRLRPSCFTSRGQSERRLGRRHMLCAFVRSGLADPSA